MRLIFLCSSIMTILANTACAHKYTKTVTYVDRDRFMGKWYVQAGRFSFLEKDVYNSVEKYTWNDEKKRIDVDFSFNKGSLTGPLKKVPQKAWIENEKTNATWSVSPFWPLKFGYLILALDPNYEWTAIGVPNQSYLWIMSHNPDFPREQVQKILEELSAEGYNTKDIEYVSHSK